MPEVGAWGGLGSMVFVTFGVARVIVNHFLQQCSQAFVLGLLGLHLV